MSELIRNSYAEQFRKLTGAGSSWSDDDVAELARQQLLERISGEIVAGDHEAASFYLQALTTNLEARELAIAVGVATVRAVLRQVSALGV